MSEISSLQKTVNRERARSGELGSQLKTVRSQAESAKQELVDYRDKATRILQSKENLLFPDPFLPTITLCPELNGSTTV